MAGDDAIFDDDKSPTTTEGVSPEAPVSSEAPARDEAGRFAPKDTGGTPAAAPETAVQGEGAPPAPAAREQHQIPLSAVLDERERRQKAEAQLALLQRQIAAQQAQQRMPDPVENAQEYTAYVQGEFQRQLLATKMQQSEFLARDKFGDALVDEALAFFDENPRDSHRFVDAPSPFHAAIKWFQEQKSVMERSAPDYEEKLRARLRAELEAEMRAGASSPAIPRSLASAPSSGRSAPPGNGDPLFD